MLNTPPSVLQIEYLRELLESGELVGLPVRASPPTVTLPRIKVLDILVI